MSIDNQLGLPEEVFEIILQHLDMEDVLSCSLVCLGWRNAVNSDRIWEKLCKKNISKERLKLRTEHKRVGSSYEVFESENWPRLCVWRRRYMDDVDLKRNWKYGSFQEDYVYGFDSRPEVWLATDNEVLLVPKDLWSSPSPYTVFNIVDHPIMTGEILLALGDCAPELIKFSNNILVIVQRTLLQVYVRDEDKNLKFKFFALFDRDHKETIPDNQDLSNWYRQIDYPSYMDHVRCDHNGKYFVGIYSRYDGSRWYSPLHIWDLEFQTKVQEVTFPRQMSGEQLKRASFFLRDNNIHIILTYLSRTFIHFYDIDKSSYSETVLQLEVDFECALITGTVAIMESLLEKKLLLFNLRDGRMLDTLNAGGLIQVKAFGNLIIYAEDEYFADPPSVTVYDTEKLRLVDKFHVERYGLILKIHIVMEDLLLICTRERLFIRDMKIREILRTVECFDFLPPDPSCSKLVVQNRKYELVVLHFW